MFVGAGYSRHDGRLDEEMVGEGRIFFPLPTMNERFYVEKK